MPTMCVFVRGWSRVFAIKRDDPSQSALEGRYAPWTEMSGARGRQTITYCDTIMLPLLSNMTFDA
jgi:hypothetical protein